MNLRIAISLALTMALSGCALPGMKMDSISELQERNVNAQVIDAAFIASQISAPKKQASHNFVPKQLQPYTVGVRDLLQIIVWGHPEITNPTGLTTASQEQGNKVRTDGTIYFPFIGLVKAEGRTVEDIRAEISRRLAPYITNPQVDVRIAAFRSRKVYVTGEVMQPGMHYLTDEQETVLDGITLAGGFKPTADLSTAYLIREGKKQRIDLNALYNDGLLANNLSLQAGDNIYVPDNTRNQVFVLGEVNKQQSVAMHRGELTLAEAIAGVEGIDLDLANPGAIYVIRGEQSKTSCGLAEACDISTQVATNVFLLDASSADALLLADRFQLQPRDVVFVSPHGLARWNRVIKQILPTVQTLYQLRILERDL